MAAADTALRQLAPREKLTVAPAMTGAPPDGSVIAKKLSATAAETAALVAELNVAVPAPSGASPNSLPPTIPHALPLLTCASDQHCTCV